jgi:dTDP-4-amino-4,6-dideoxygalactose transaminase
MLPTDALQREENTSRVAKRNIMSYEPQTEDVLQSLASFGGEPVITEEISLAWPPISDSLRGAVERILDSGRLSINDGTGVMAEFEQNFADYCGSNHALSFTNGSAALHSALFAVGVRPGDEVIVPTMTWGATANAVLMCGGRPVFCDVDPDTMCMSRATILARVSRRTRAIVFVHLWGNPAGLVECVALADELGIPVIEDASHAHGAHIRGKKIGTFGAVGCFSMQASKLLGAGEAGVAVTDSKELYDAMLALGHFGGRIEVDSKTDTFESYAYTGLGPKYRPHPIAIAIANDSLKSLDDWIAARQARSADLTGHLANLPGLNLPETPADSSRGAFYGYRIRNIEQETGLPTPLLIRLLRDEGVSVTSEWYRPLHRQPLYSGAHTFEKLTGLAWPYPNSWESHYHDDEFPGAVEIATNAICVNIPTLCSSSLMRRYGEAFAKIITRFAANPGLADLASHRLEAGTGADRQLNSQSPAHRKEVRLEAISSK